MLTIVFLTHKTRTDEFSYIFTAATATKCERPYTVKEGDICDSISAANSVSTYVTLTFLLLHF